ncbi:hypothetical protein KFL_006770060 [Klebsormidium nitens]|uniref:Uncharacterized protein n=1 Tax=Klebsormidium nitens TaxID=105231 RepID=A0A1Y1IJ33_KLENI|nr:hypothetical protein KFL_006770060 [Klebsormidium nitens]|eukprot:GAQ90713.1 hypothetical protein KFL_006770060 [Klebsormidium nitens]
MISTQDLAAPAPTKDRPSIPLSEELFKAITDVLVAVLAYVVIVHVARYYDETKVVHYDRLLGFSVTLAGIFANDILGK